MNGRPASGADHRRKEELEAARQEADRIYAAIGEAAERFG